MEPLPPFLFAATTQRERRRLARLREAGRIRRIGPRLYTSLPEPEVADAVRGAWATIVAALHPGALISHRTALEYIPSPERAVFLTSTTNRAVEYPGLTLRFVRGPGPLHDDPPHLGARASSLPRALLENLMPDARTTVPRTVPLEDLERRLEQILRDGGADQLGIIRDRAREVAAELGWRPAFDRLDGIIGALLGTRDADHVVGQAARARALGQPYDAVCLDRLNLLFGELRTRALRTEPDHFDAPGHFENKAFFEAYFSNYIEGTIFAVEEAEAIVFDHRIPASRPVDAHDIVGTFAVVSDPAEMRRTPGSPAELVELLRTRHRTILERRPDTQPGTFKQEPNRAGDTHFVLPEYVAGTLTQGYRLLAELEPGLPRAIFVMFLVSDVHPFRDGNGRVARIMMNAELVATGAATIIVPTVYRDDYLIGLRALTRRHRATPLIDGLLRAAAFSHRDFSSYPDVLADLRRHNWFRDPDDARIITDP